MAKKKADVNKSEEIRKELKRNPQITPKEVSAVLKKKGIAVTPAYVSTIKFGMKKRSGTNGASRRRRGGAVSITALQQAREFVDQVGGLKEAQQALEAWESLTG